MAFVLFLCSFFSVLSFVLTTPVQNHPYPGFINGGPQGIDHYLSNENHPSALYSPTDKCSCLCNYRKQRETICEWKMMFKAVAGSRRTVYDDYISGGNINVDALNAMNIRSELPYRDGSILDDWDHIHVQQVKVEVYASDNRKTWYLFNAKGKDYVDWMSQDNLIASPYDGLKTASLNYFSVKGSTLNSRRFFINNNYGGCTIDCGYLMTVDVQSNPGCGYEDIYERPYFLYNKRTDSCGRYYNTDQMGVGDRLVLWAKVCEIHD